MKKATSIVRGSLRLVSLVITIVMVVTLATVGYSAYQDFNVLASPQPSQNLKVQSSVIDGALHLTVAGTIPNNGLYPLNFYIILSAESHGNTLAESTSEPIRILPNEIKQFNISLDINPYSISNSTEQSALLTNGGQIVLSTGIRASIEPFASIRVTGGSNLTLPPLMGDLKVGPGEVLHTPNGTVLAVPISFVDMANFSFPFNVFATLSDPQGGLATISASSTGLAVSGKETSFRLNFSIPGERTLSGTYPLELRVTIGGATIPVHVKVEVRG
ncbi:MAG: hypothetical protein HYW93_06675 [Thaumarchaeota archaeon]|nr:hypothetical protein [Nitrososphaerota archaeon]